MGLALGLWAAGLRAQEWTQPVRGSWIREDDTAQAGDLILAQGKTGCEIVVPETEPSAVKQAAIFLAGDIEKLSGYKPSIVSRAGGKLVAIRLATFDSHADLPKAIQGAELADKWEAYTVVTNENTVWLVGSNFRGTAFAAYTLSERLGIDPLYLWSGYTPEKHATLVLKKTEFFSGPPTFKYRGFFHDDEDVLPRPFDEQGYPLQTGTVAKIWYERFFETALRLRLNMVAPYVRVQRPFEVQKTASDWGLFYTSHHYDVLLSNPWGFTRFGLGASRHAGTDWDWFKNKEGMMNFWRGGVMENRELDCIWPVGLRDTSDRGYRFPLGMAEEEKNKIFREVIDEQVKMTKELLPKDKAPIFHFTLYTEMLELYQQGKLNLPKDVIVVWTDDNDGHMRALPKARDQWKHGIYYHLAYYTRYLYPTKQVAHTVSPMRIADEFEHAVDSGATEYMLVNVSEVREFVLEARMLAEICWDAPKSLVGPTTANRYLRWWAQEYFGAAAADEVISAYRSYYSLLDSADKIWSGSTRVQEALTSLTAKLSHKSVKPLEPPDALDTLQQRDHAFHAAMDVIAKANAKMSPMQQQFLYENVTLNLLMEMRQNSAALLLAQAMDEPDDAKVRKLCFAARDELKVLEDEIRRAERPPFENWYRKTWIKSDESPSNVHRSYEHVQAFLIDHYLVP